MIRSRHLGVYLVSIVTSLASLAFVPYGHLFEKKEEEYAVCEVQDVDPEYFEGIQSPQGLVFIGVATLAELYIPLIDVLPHEIQRIDYDNSDDPGDGVFGLGGECPPFLHVFLSLFLQEKEGVDPLAGDQEALGEDGQDTIHVDQALNLYIVL